MTLKELSTEYKRSAQFIRKRLKELRIALKETEDADERWRLKRRIAELQPMLTQTNKIAELLERYYERGYYRDASYSVNALDYRLRGGAIAKETSAENRRERADESPEGYVSSVLCRRFYDHSHRGRAGSKQEHGLSHAKKSRAENSKNSSISLKTEADICDAINQFLRKKE